MLLYLTAFPPNKALGLIDKLRKTMETMEPPPVCPPIRPGWLQRCDKSPVYPQGLPQRADDVAAASGAAGSHQHRQPVLHELHHPGDSPPLTIPHFRHCPPPPPS